MSETIGHTHTTLTSDPAPDVVKGSVTGDCPIETYPEYVIKSPNDFLAIPDSYIEKALEEFCDGIRRARFTKARAQAYCEALQIPDMSIEMKWESVTLIDDGKYDVLPPDITVCCKTKV